MSVRILIAFSLGLLLLVTLLCSYHMCNVACSRERGPRVIHMIKCNFYCYKRIGFLDCWFNFCRTWLSFKSLFFCRKTWQTCISAFRTQKKQLSLSLWFYSWCVNSSFNSRKIFQNGIQSKPIYILFRRITWNNLRKS